MIDLEKSFGPLKLIILEILNLAKNHNNVS